MRAWTARRCTSAGCGFYRMNGSFRYEMDQTMTELRTASPILIWGRPAPGNSVPELVRGKAAAHGDRIFAEIDGRTLTYRELDDLSDRIAANLSRVGLAPGDCVASLMFNCAEQVLAWIGVNKAGGVWAPLNASLIGDDLARTLRDTAARIFVVDAENLPKVAALPGELVAGLRLYVVGGVPSASAGTAFSDLSAGTAFSDLSAGTAFSALLEPTAPVPAKPCEPGDPA